VSICSCLIPEFNCWDVWYLKLQPHSQRQPRPSGPARGAAYGAAATPGGGAATATGQVVREGSTAFASRRRTEDSAKRQPNLPPGSVAIGNGPRAELKYLNPVQLAWPILRANERSRKLVQFLQGWEEHTSKGICVEILVPNVTTWQDPRANYLLLFLKKKKVRSTQHCTTTTKHFLSQKRN
jgi:hypothetical protein